MHQEFAALVAAQYGVVTRNQLLAHLSPKQIRRIVTNGELIRLYRNTYAYAVTSHSWEQKLLAAVISVEGAVASHRSAARLWGLISTSEVEMTTPRIFRVKRPHVTVHQSDQLIEYVTVTKSIPVTSIQRTLVDLTSCVGPELLAKCLDTALIKRLTTIAAVQHCLDLMVTKGRSRITILRELLACRNPTDEKLESFLEREVLGWIRSASLSEPIAQFWCTATRNRYRMDLAYPDLKIDIEIDGPHHLDSSVATYDRARDADTTAHGWTTLRCTPTTNRQEFINDLRSTMRLRRMSK